MRVSLTVRVNDKEARTVLSSIQSRIKDMRPVMRRISGLMYSSVMKNLEVEGRHKWQSLHLMTIMQRIKEGYWPGKILHRTGTLRASVAQYFDGQKAGVGTNLKYAAIHQYGGTTTIKGRHAIIPARPYLKLTDDETGEIYQWINDYLTGGLK